MEMFEGGKGGYSHSAKCSSPIPVEHLIWCVFMRACKHTIYINFESALYLRILAKPIIYCCLCR